MEGPPTSCDTPVSRNQEKIDETARELGRLYPGKWAFLLAPAEGKKLRGKDWNGEATRRYLTGDPARGVWLRQMAHRLDGGGNVALVIPPAILGLDTDTPKSVRFFLDQLPEAPRQLTKHGTHFLVRIPPNVALPAKAGVKLANGITVDLRVAGKSALICEPSRHPADGTPYEWELELPPDPKDVPECPSELLDQIISAITPASEPKSGNGKGGKIPDGERNDFLYRQGCAMARRNMGEEAIVAALAIENERACEPPLGLAEIRLIARSAASKAEGNREEEDDRPVEPLFPATLEEIEADELPEALCERIVWEGCPSLLMGLAKEGKSYLAVQLALCLSGGVQFLGLETRRSQVLYVSWELTQKALLARMTGIATDCGLPEPRALIRAGTLSIYAHRKVESARRLDFEDKRDWERFLTLVDNSEAEVIFIDTLRKALPHVKLKDDQGWSRGLQKVTAFARERGIALVLIDHGHRGRKEDTAAEFAMGSQVKGSELPCLVKLGRRRKDGEADRWKIEIASWFDDSGEPIWYQRPEDEEGYRGAGCARCDAPEGGRPGRAKQATAVEMESWLEDRLDPEVGINSKVIFREAETLWPGVGSRTLREKLRRARKAVEGRTEPIEGVTPPETLWFGKATV